MHQSTKVKYIFLFGLRAVFVFAVYSICSQTKIHLTEIYEENAEPQDCML